MNLHLIGEPHDARKVPKIIVFESDATCNVIHTRTTFRSVEYTEELLSFDHIKSYR